ncbi:hypothetical protein MBLNU459_g1127t1 [Dothideomycetes sp. NU459]
MPCFKGLAVSIHTPDGPLAEYSIQKQSKFGRITSYIPVPPANIPADSTDLKPQQSTFAVSITLLTPGLRVPYSAPKPTAEDPYPQGRVVGNLPGTTGVRGTYGPAIPPYIPRTVSPNETVAAYIYFDGRAKEEVATLLRKGEETWVNSRWVSVPESEGGGLAEREFLFREVGLERWLNGLDLTGKDKAKVIERRQKKMEKKRQVKKEELDSDDEAVDKKPNLDRNGVLRYGNDATSPVENVTNDDDLLSDSDSDDEPPEPEAAGQIKVALFRVLASGEIKRGEYSPQFDAHDDEVEGNGDAGASEDVDHTTSFAKPKTLDPKSISTQTVTGLDPPDAPFAVFTFFYRGETQLRKMGILPALESAQPTPPTAKRKSVQTDFSKLGPLKSAGTKGFSSYRDKTAVPRKQSKDEDAMDSDADEDDDRVHDEPDEVEVKQENGQHLSPEDARKQGELAEGVQRIKLKRQHSSEMANPNKSPHLKNSDSQTSTSPNSVTANAGTPSDRPSPKLLDETTDSFIGSPLKRHRASMAGLEASMLSSVTSADNASLSATPAPVEAGTDKNVNQPVDSDEEL